MVVTVGETLGLLPVDVNPDGLLVQLYVLPETDAAPMETELPEHIVLAEPVEAAGSGFTVTFTESEFEQPVAVIVSVSLYIVVTLGLTEGFALEEVNPLGLLVQLKLRPPGDVEPMLADVPLHTV